MFGEVYGAPAGAVESGLEPADGWVCAICGRPRVNPYGAPAGDRPQACGDCGDLLAAAIRPLALGAGLALAL